MVPPHHETEPGVWWGCSSPQWSLPRGIRRVTWGLSDSWDPRFLRGCPACHVHTCDHAPGDQTGPVQPVSPLTGPEPSLPGSDALSHVTSMSVTSKPPRVLLRLRAIRRPGAHPLGQAGQGQAASPGALQATLHPRSADGRADPSPRAFRAVCSRKRRLSLTFVPGPSCLPGLERLSRVDTSAPAQGCSPRRGTNKEAKMTFDRLEQSLVPFMPTKG